MMNDTIGQTPGQSAGSASPELQFYIPATSSLLERRPRTLKNGDTFGVFDHYGNVLSGNGSPEGVYYRDTRYVSDLRVLINGRRPLLLSSTVQDNNAVLTADLTNPDFVEDGRLLLPKDTVHVVRSMFLWQSTAYERLGLHHYAPDAQRIEVTVLFNSDFADLFEVRGQVRPARGETEIDVGRDRVVFAYRGLDGVVRRSIFRFDPVPNVIDGHHAVFDLRLEPKTRAALFVGITCEEEGRVEAESAPPQFYTGLRTARRRLRKSAARAAAIRSSNDIFNEIVRRSMADLTMLTTETPEGPYPYAGIPWFSTAFGRDAIITAMETLWLDPDIARGVLRYLAATQATEVKPEADAEPGKILHEARSGEMARLGEIPFGLYYGSVDSTPLFVMLAGMHFQRTGDLGTISDLWPHIEAALAWIDRNCQQSRGGFLTYQRASDTGLANQGWKDSSDSVFHADGSDATGPIALCEVQGYVYAAKRHAAAIAAAIGFSARAVKLQQQADHLQALFDAAFWCESIGTYALALDGAGKPCCVRSSNAAQLLFTGIVPFARADRLANQLFDRDFFSGWGIRTIAASEARYNPMSYHNGSVWPHDNALIGFGLARHGLKAHLLRLFAAIFDAARYMDLRRLPELYCGFGRVRGKGPTFYPVACSPQAWACAAPLALLQASLGLELDYAADTVRFCEPRLPAFLDQVELRGLALGESRFDLLLRRHGDDVSVNILNRSGDARVEVTL